METRKMAANALLSVLIWTGWTCDVFAAEAAGDKDVIVVRNGKRLSVTQIPCERVPVGVAEDYKPSIVLLPDGEILLCMFSGRRLKDGKIAEQAVLYRSRDGGKTWSERETPDIAGREPSLSVTSRGTVLITAHLLGQDVRNKDGYTHSYLHRSEDRGKTWSTTRIEPAGFRPRVTGLTSRNVLQLSDGTLLLGVSEHGIKQCKSYVWQSADDGKTWETRYLSRFADVPENYPYTLFGEAHLWQARAGKLYAILRVGAGNTWPLTGTTDPGNNDQSERMIIYSSENMGKKWSQVSDLGGYGQMYMSILRLGGDRLLLTYTQRAIVTPLGVRGAIGRELADGFQFDLARDQIMIDTKTPVGMASGGGFGPTVLLADGTLVTSYTYRDAERRKHAEVVRWTMPALK
ncbi:MAG: sialidase family protein [Planctomycetota bacterium]|nr:sialidase family protein [Planctomycetota bacterium]